jgi:hypothetical protein
MRSAAIGAAAATLVLALVVAVGVAFSPSRAAAQVGTPPVAAVSPGSVAGVAQSVGPAVVSVRTDQGLGSGVI